MQKKEVDKRLKEGSRTCDSGADYAGPPEKRLKAK